VIINQMSVIGDRRSRIADPVFRIGDRLPKISDLIPRICVQASRITDRLHTIRDQTRRIRERTARIDIRMAAIDASKSERRETGSRISARRAKIMDSLNRRRLETLKLVQAWAETEPQLFRPGSRAAAGLRRIGAAILAAGDASVAGRSAAHAEFDGSRPLSRRRLRAAVLTLCRATQALDVEAPGLSTVYHRPPYQSDSDLIEFAGRMLIELEPVRGRLLDALDLPSNYFDVVRQHMRALAGASEDQNDARRSHVAARGAIDAALASGFEALNILDAIMRHQLADNPAKLAGWQHCRRIRKSRHRRRRGASSVA
jgi:hypothetical protein